MAFQRSSSLLTDAHKILCCIFALSAAVKNSQLGFGPANSAALAEPPDSPPSQEKSEYSPRYCATGCLRQSSQAAVSPCLAAVPANSKIVLPKKAQSLYPQLCTNHVHFSLLYEPRKARRAEGQTICMLHCHDNKTLQMEHAFGDAVVSVVTGRI